MPTDTHTSTATAGPKGPRTGTETRIWDALSPQPQTTAQVVAAAGVGRSTAGKTLARWAKAGLVTRHDGDEDNPAATWSYTRDQHETTPSEPALHPDPDTDIGKPQDAPRPAAPGGGTAEDSTAEGSDEAEADTEDPVLVELDSAKPERLKPGGLYGLVEDYLREHPGEEFGPSQIGKDLNRSSGAVNNALEKMTTKGVAVKTQAVPKRFALAPDEER